MKKILVLGSTNMDFVIGMDRMPELGETLMSKSFARVPGGKGANQAYACGRLGGSVSFLSAVGDDGLGREIIENLEQANVDCSKVIYCGRESTGLAVICVDHAGNNSIMVIPGANCACTKSYVASMEERLEEFDIVMAQLEVPQDGVCYMMQRAYELGKITILNPAPAPEELPAELYPCLHYITPNETELQRLSGRRVDSPEAAAAAADVLLARGARNVIVTLGGKGALLKNREHETLYPPPAVQVVDTTAAGDTFNGAFAVKLAEGAALDTAIGFANAAAALAVSRTGAQTSVPLRSEVEEWMDRMEALK